MMFFACISLDNRDMANTSIHLTRSRGVRWVSLAVANKLQYCRLTLESGRTGHSYRLDLIDCKPSHAAH